MARILVVDDEADVLEVIQACLQGAGYESVTARTGPEALERVGREQPDLMILDVMIPGLDGFEVLSRLRADPSTAELPVIMLTALDPASFAAKGRDLGADFYWVKPFDPDQLVTLINRILEFK